MTAHTWIHTALWGLIMVYSASTQTCSFDAVFTMVTDTVVPASNSLQASDPNLSFYTDTLRFTDEETQQETENAIQHFKTQFGLDFSDTQPNDANQRFLGNATFAGVIFPINATLVLNNWIATGRRRSKCFPVSSGSFQVTFNGTEMLHGVYGGEDGKPVNVGDFVVHGYFIIFDACAQQPILIQFQSDIPARRLPVEGWSIEALQLYNRQLGRGRGQSVFKIRLSPDDPTMFVVQTQDVLSFP